MLNFSFTHEFSGSTGQGRQVLIDCLPRTNVVSSHHDSMEKGDYKTEIFKVAQAVPVRNPHGTTFCLLFIKPFMSTLFLFKKIFDLF